MSVSEPVQNNRLLHIESCGQGEDVVLLHGWGMHGAYWQQLVNSLKDNYRLHCIDLPGHGKSEYQGQQQLDEFVSSIMQTIDSQTQRSFHLIGWSLGGLISQRLTQLYPDRVKRLLLIASTASFVQRDNWPHAMREQVLKGFADNLLQEYKTTLNRFLALQVFGSDNQKQELRKLKAKLYSRGEPHRAALQAGLALLQSVDMRSELTSLDLPVMLLGGERDTLVPQTALSDMAGLLIQAEVHIIKGAGHAPFMSHQMEVIKRCQVFLNHE